MRGIIVHGWDATTLLLHPEPGGALDNSLGGRASARRVYPCKKIPPEPFHAAVLTSQRSRLISHLELRPSVKAGAFIYFLEQEPANFSDKGAQLSAFIERNSMNPLDIAVF